MGADAKTQMKVDVTDAAAKRIATIVASEPGKIRTARFGRRRRLLGLFLQVRSGR